MQITSVIAPTCFSSQTVLSSIPSPRVNFNQNAVLNTCTMNCRIIVKDTHSLHLLSAVFAAYGIDAERHKFNLLDTAASAVWKAHVASPADQICAADIAHRDLRTAEDRPEYGFRKCKAADRSRHHPYWRR